MSPTAIIREAAADGMALALSAVGIVKASGDREILARWLPVLRQDKPAARRDPGTRWPDLRGGHAPWVDPGSVEDLRVVRLWHGRDGNAARGAAPSRAGPGPWTTPWRPPVRASRASRRPSFAPCCPARTSPVKAGGHSSCGLPCAPTPSVSRPTTKPRGRRAKRKPECPRYEVLRHSPGAAPRPVAAPRTKSI